MSEIFKINNLSWNGCLNGIQLSRHKDRTNVLDKICYKYFGNYKYQNKMRVYQLCRRKSKEFVDILNKDMKNSNDEERRFVIHVTKDEWNNRLNDMIVCFEQRFKLKQEILRILSEKLQKQDVLCWLKCN